MNRKPRRREGEMRPEYEIDYSKAERGKHFRRLVVEGANVVVLEPDVARAFRDSASVNDALRSLLTAARAARRAAVRPSRGPRKRAAR